MCSWNLTENIGTKWDFPSKIKSLEIKDYPKHWKAKGREIINCKLGWIMLFGRVQSFEDELEIPCHSWICDKPLGQMLVLPISGTKAADCSGRRLAQLLCGKQHAQLHSCACWEQPECYSIFTDDFWGHGGVQVPLVKYGSLDVCRAVYMNKM